MTSIKITVEDVKGYLRERINFLGDTLDQVPHNAKHRPMLEASQAQYASILRWIANAEHGTDGVRPRRTVTTTP